MDKCKASEDVQCHTYLSLLESDVESSVARYRANQLRSGLQKHCMHMIYALLPLLLVVGGVEGDSRYGW